MKLNYKSFGEEGDNLIVIHGLLGSLNNWQTLAKEFGKHFKTFTIDQRNHGKTGHEDEWNYEVMAQDLKEFIDEHNIIDPIILGHSMGGKTVMRFVMDFKNYAKKIIIADISPRYYPPHHQSIFDGLISINLSNLKSRKEADDVLSNYVSNIGERQFLLQNLERSSTGFNWKMNLEVITKKLHNVGEAQEPSNPINIPTLFLRGENSHYIGNQDKKIISQYFSNANIITIPNAGHWLHAEQPRLFFDEVMHFIK